MKNYTQSYIHKYIYFGVWEKLVTINFYCMEKGSLNIFLNFSFCASRTKVGNKDRGKSKYSELYFGLHSNYS